MKRCWTDLIAAALLLILPYLLAASGEGKDFLITLNGSKLTGEIKVTANDKGKSEISFQNDFGDVYAIHPATIFGFAYQDKDEVFLYESKKLDGKWQFLKVEKKGEAVNLYSSSEKQLQFISSGESPVVVKVKNPQSWVQFKGQPPIKVHKWNYKGLLKEKMAAYPELVEMIGKRGFKFSNLSMMVDLYNKFHSDSFKTL
ncbi:MAG: hypothetical protein AAF502_08855 [Bacteroidota bacterium]